MQMRSDEDLMDAVAGGDTAALGVLYTRHGEWVRRHAAGMTHRREGSDDITQETWVRVLAARGTWDRQDAGFRPWLRRIATNVVLDRWRRVKCRPETLVDELPTVGIHTNPAAGIDLRLILDRLPDDTRETLVLAADGLDHNELARELGIRPDAARARLSRARRQLRESCNPDAVMV
jgi:RNA polymerase sigma factor (sigma-70 family)